MAQFDKNDDSIVVIVGSGAGGGTLGNELAQKGVKVVILEAGARNEIADFVNDEWESFAQLAWKDKRTTSGTWLVHRDFPNLPAWIVKSVGGSTVHWAGASLRFEPHEFKIKSTYSDLKGANLLDWPITREELDPWYAKAEDKMGTTRTNGIPGLPGNNNFKVMKAGADKLGYKECHTGRMSINSQPRDGRRLVPADRLLLPGLQVGRQMVDALHRDPERRGDRQPRGAAELDGAADRARQDGQGDGRRLRRREGREAAPEGAYRRRRRQLAREPAPAAQQRLQHVPGRSRQLVGPGRAQLHAPHDGQRVRRLREAGAHVPRHDDGRHHPRRGEKRPVARVRRRLRDGDAVARPAVHGGVPAAGRLGSDLLERDGAVLAHGRHGGSSARTCRRPTTASRWTRA